MENLFVLLFLVSLVLFILGLLNPNASLFWYRKTRSRKASCLIYGLSLAISFIFVGVLGEKNLNTQNKIAEKIAPADSIAQKQQELKQRKESTLTANQLVQFYAQNEVKAYNDFKGKKFYVVGYIEHIGKDIMDNTYVSLKSGDLIRGVQCFIEDENVLAQLHTGQKITVLGTDDGLMVNVLMKDCTVVDNLPNN
jgi:hypothetical protein